METYQSLVIKALQEVQEIFPWDLEEESSAGQQLLLVDLRDPAEHARCRLENSIFVPRGVLEAACDWNYEETEPLLAGGRDQNIVLICNSGNRSALAAKTMQRMGFSRVRSLKTGIRGWNDAELPLFDSEEKPVDGDQLDALFHRPLAPEKLEP